MESKGDTQKIDVAQPPIKTMDSVESGVFRHPDGKRLLFEPDQEYQVKTCCGPVTSCDKGLMEFLAKSIVSLSVLAFCFLQLSQGLQSEFASSTISLILGTYLGSTVMATPKKKES